MSLFHGQSKLSPEFDIYQNFVFFLLLEFTLFINNFMKNRHKDVQKIRNDYSTFGYW